MLKGLAFLACESLVAKPWVDLRLYTNVTFTAMSVVMLLFFMMFTGNTFLQVILMQQLLDYTPAQAGLALLHWGKCSPR